MGGDCYTCVLCNYTWADDHNDWGYCGGCEEVLCEECLEKMKQKYGWYGDEKHSSICEYGQYKTRPEWLANDQWNLHLSGDHGQCPEEEREGNTIMCTDCDSTVVNKTRFDNWCLSRLGMTKEEAMEECYFNSSDEYCEYPSYSEDEEEEDKEEEPLAPLTEADANGNQLITSYITRTTRKRRSIQEIEAIKEEENGKKQKYEARQEWIKKMNNIETEPPSILSIPDVIRSYSH